MLRKMILFGCLLLSSCLEKRSSSGDSLIFSTGKRLAELTDSKLGEVSGLAASAVNPGLLWTHNDGGNPAEVYLINQNLKIRLSCTLKGVKNRDWEDIAVGPGPDENKHYLYVADIGDNNARYPVKFIYRFEEPVWKESKAQITITSFDTIAFRLEDEEKDTEAIMVDPKTKNIYVVSKREKPVTLYEIKYPFSVRDTVTAVKVDSLPFTQIVSACISSDGKSILMKNYSNIFYWDTEGKPIETVLKKEPFVLKYIEEPQGEAITFSRDGSGFYTLSEKLMGEKTFLYYYKREERKIFSKRP